MSDSERPGYPPEFHLVRDLAPIVERDADGSAILLPIVPALFDDGGRPHLGVVATVVDVIAGETAVREVLPRWIATSNLCLQVGDLPDAGTIRARPRVLRKGRTTLVMEVDLDHLARAGVGGADGRDGSATTPATTRLGLATVGFSILPKRNPLQARVDWAETPEPRSEFATSTSGFRKPLYDTLGLEFDAQAPGIARLGVEPYVINTLGAMQGGAVAILIDAAADHFAADRFGTPARVRGLEIHYLSLARSGPVRAEARALGPIGSGLLVRVSLFDEGADDRLLTVATATVDRATNTAAPGTPGARARAT